MRADPDVPVVGVVVVNWNDAAATIACLDSLAATCGVACRAYVVDNASADGSAARIAAAHPAAVVVRSPVNLGFAGGCNLGVRRALADGVGWVWLLNNDATVEPDTAAALLAHARSAGPAILSPKIVYADRPGVLWSAGGYFDRALKSHHVGRDEPDRAQYDAPRTVDWASGCSLFFPAEVWRQVGPLDERYFLYLEDVDWCLRARRAGVPVRYVPAARVRHAVSRSVSRLGPARLWYYSWRNYYLLATRRGRWWQRLRAWADLASRFAKIAVRSAVDPACRHDPVYQARTRGLLDFVRGRFGAWQSGEVA